MESYDLNAFEEDRTLLLRAWPDIEAELLAMATGDDAFRAKQASPLVESLRHAFRVEVQQDADVFGGWALGYVLFFDVSDYHARHAAATLSRAELDMHVYSHARVQGTLADTRLRVVPIGKPILGDVCERVLATVTAAELVDLPEPPPPPRTNVPYVERGLHLLTPIEAPFYDALQETDLVFAVQPRVQGDRTYRPDFIVFYRGQGVVVELDGHEGHKTKEQRSHDAERERWFKKKGLSTIRWTGTQVYADAKSCVDELLDVLRQAESRP